MELLDRMVPLCNFMRNCQKLFFSSCYVTLNFHWQHLRFPISPHPSLFSSVLLFLTCETTRRVTISMKEEKQKKPYRQLRYKAKLGRCGSVG